MTDKETVFKADEVQRAKLKEPGRPIYMHTHSSIFRGKLVGAGDVALKTLRGSERFENDFDSFEHELQVLNFLKQFPQCGPITHGVVYVNMNKLVNDYQPWTRYIDNKRIEGAELEENEDIAIFL